MLLKAKKVNTCSDLAVFGAAPAFEETLHVGRPNIGRREDFLERVEKMFDRNWLTNDGPYVKDFESKVASYLGVKHCIAMCNGTIALEIAIRSLELKGEVILPSYTFIATAHSLQWQGITPVFADIDPVSHNLDPSSVRDRITDKTTGIVGVHLWGRGANHAELQSIAKEHDLRLLYDAAHAFGCSMGGKKIGGFGDCEVLSFHATKFFNTFEGGAVVTNNDDLASKIRLMRNFGFAGLDNVASIGTNGKMTEICAAMGLTNFDHIDTVIATNQANFKSYADGIADISSLELCKYDESELNNFQYVVMEVDDRFPLYRDEILEVLHAENIFARRYFWPGCHAMQPYKDSIADVEDILPNTIAVADKTIVLPTGTAVSAEHIQIIVKLLEFMAVPQNALKIRKHLKKPVSFRLKQVLSSERRKAS